MPFGEHLIVAAEIEAVMCAAVSRRGGAGPTMAPVAQDPPNRRDVTGLLLAGGAASVAMGCEEGPPPDLVGGPRTVVHIDDLVAGRAVDFAYPEAHHAAFAIRLGARAAGGVGPDGDIVAFQRACPHMGCRITRIDAERGAFGPCACHQSLFDLRQGGLQIYGRASQNLVQIQLELLPDGTLCAVGLSGLTYGEALEG